MKIKTDDIVIVKLDRPRVVRYGHKALKILCQLLDISFDEVGTVKMNPENIEKFMYCGLLDDAKINNETLTLDQMEDLLDKAKKYKDITGALSKAINYAMEDDEEETEKN